MLGGRSSLLTVIDQAVVSGSNFLTGILLVRGLGLHGFGQFTIAYTILLFANSLQVSFVSAPMVTLAPGLAEPWSKLEYLRGMMGMQTLFCAGLSVLWVLCSALLCLFKPGLISLTFIAAYTATVALFQMQDWLRRYYFCSRKAHEALWNDTVSYFGQVIVLAVLLWLHRLSLSTAYWSIALTSGVAMGLGLVRDRLTFSMHEVKKAWIPSRTMARNLTCANVLQWLGSQGVLLSGAFVLGASQAGGVRAAQNLLGPVHLAYQAMENIVPIRASEEAAIHGIEGARRYLRRFTIVGLVILTAMFLPLAIFSKSLLRTVYGPATTPFWGIVVLQLAYLWVGLPWRQSVYLFRTIGKSHYIVWANACASILAFSSVFLFMKEAGAAGIVMATITGEVVGLTVMSAQWKLLHARMKHQPGKGELPARAST